MRLEVEPDSVALEVGDQLLDRPVERVLGLQRPRGVAGELGIDHSALQLAGDLQEPTPVANLRLALPLIRRQAVEHRHECEDLHAGLRHRLCCLRDQRNPPSASAAR